MNDRQFPGDINVDDPAQNEFVQEWLETYASKYGPIIIYDESTNRNVNTFDCVIEAIQENYSPASTSTDERERMRINENANNDPRTP